MIQRIKAVAIIAGVAVLLVPGLASAHVLVTPGSVNVGSEQVFSISVPNEQQSTMTQLKLAIPSGVSDVIPTVAPGWTIATTPVSAKDDTVKEITWSDGQLPAGQRQDFSFSAQVPAAAGELHWNAYQTYADGTVTHWDQKPTGSDDADGDAGPYSVTKVVDDLSPAAAHTSANSSAVSRSNVALVLSAAALGVSLVLNRRRARR